jgi:DNA-binding CsgD family transcriptional regulator
MQLAVVQRLCRGESTDEIAAHFELSRNTIVNDIKAVYQKFGVSRRYQTVVKAVEFGYATIKVKN